MATRDKNGVRVYGTDVFNTLDTAARADGLSQDLALDADFVLRGDGENADMIGEAVTGFNPGVTTTVRIRKYGKYVVINWNGFVGTSSATLMSIVEPVPVGFRPPSDQFEAIPVRDNSVFVEGMVRVDPLGNIAWGATQDGVIGNFTASGTKGSVSGTVSYTVS